MTPSAMIRDYRIEAAELREPFLQYLVRVQNAYRCLAACIHQMRRVSPYHISSLGGIFATLALGEHRVFVHASDGGLQWLALCVMASAI